MSLRWRLFVILILSTSLVWLSGTAWTYFGSRSEIEHLLDRRLMEAARMVISLSAAPAADQHASAAETEEPLTGGGRYEHRLSCQIWSFDGRLVGRSSNAPATELTAVANGFSEHVIDGITYRVYAMTDPIKGVRVLVGDNLQERDQVIRDLLRRLIVPAAIVLPLAAVLIWASIRRGLHPLKRATAMLSFRGAENLTPIEVGRTPSEIRPLIAALNMLFERVVAAREHERSFVAYAAHELRTPLAGLKTQAQVAASATDAKMRSGALDLLSKGVDRTARLIQQLLAISRLDAGTAPAPTEWIELDAAIRDLRAGIGRDLGPQRIVLGPGIVGRQVAFNRELFDLAVRNLLENALQHTPDTGAVTVELSIGGAAACLLIDDEGPGIPADERGLVLQRFYRGRHKSPTGSGLGLPIVAAAAERAAAELRLDPSPRGRGLRASIRFPASRIRDAITPAASAPAGTAQPAPRTAPA